MFKKLLYIISLLFFAKMSVFGQTTSNNMWLSGDSCMGNGAVNLNMIHAGVTVSGFATGMTVKFYWGDGDSTLATSVQTYFYASHTYASAGTYTVSAIIFNPTGSPIDTLTQTYNTFCSIVMGHVYKRVDANCVQDPTTEFIINSPVQIEVRKAGVPVDTISSNGYFYKAINGADLVSVFSLHVISPPSGTLIACPSSDYTFKFDTLNYNNFPGGFKYAVDCDPAVTGFDLSVTGNGFFRPVANSYIYLSPRNSSCNAQAGVVTLNLSPKYSFSSSNPAPASVSGNTITWNTGAITNANYSFIYVTLNPVGTLTPGDTVMNHVSISPTAGDLNLANNNINMIDSIRASFDPNEKHADPMGDIMPSQLMTYTIHFENLGNDTAFNIHIMDTLSSLLNAGSFKLITSSHPVSSQIINSAFGKILKFDFANIRLADASAPNENKGFVTYQIQASSALAANQVIENTASIYFDINPAVVTNTTKNKYAIPNSITDYAQSKRLNVYPNPASEELYVEQLNQFKQVHILNALGQLVMSQYVKSGAQSISINQLPSGVYFIKANNDSGTYLQKFIKK